MPTDAVCNTFTAYVDVVVAVFDPARIWIIFLTAGSYITTEKDIHTNYMDNNRIAELNV